MRDSPNPSVTSALRASREAIAGAVAELTLFQSGSEKVFLLAASRLGELQRQSRELVDSAKSAAGLSAGRGEKSPVEHLVQELAQLEQHLAVARAASGASIEPLRGVLSRLEKLAKSSPEFRRFAQTLNMLSVNIHVENSRASGHRVGMETVAVDIRELGKRVEPRFAAILTQASSLRRLAEGALGATEQFLGRQSKSSADMIAEVRDGVASMRALASSAAAIADEAGVTSDNVVSSISQVLTSLQIHDVTRQMIEHAIEELGAFEQEVNASLAQVAARPEPWLAHASVLCQLEAAQLRSARRKLVAALGDIARNLGQVSGRLVGLGKATQKLERGEDLRGSPLEKISRGVAEATRTFEEHLEHEKQTGVAVERVSQTVQDIASGLRDIEGIGIEVKFIALNALIKSSMLGSQGRVLSVLSSAVRTLSVEVVQATQGVSKILKEIAAAGVGLKDSAQAAQIAEGAAIASGLEEIVRELGRFHQRLRAGIAGLTTGGAQVQVEVDQLVQKLEEQTQAADALEGIEDALERAGAAAAQLVSAAELARARDLSSAFARYTMHDERVTHQGVTQTKSAPAPQTPNSQGSELGDNVELF